MALDRTRCIELVTMTQPNSDPAKRDILVWLGGTTKSGWYGRFLQNYIVPLVNVGIRRFLLHNPFGLDHANGQAIYSLDQYLAAKNEKLTWLHSDFIKSVRAFQVKYPSVELIGYLGHPKLRMDSLASSTFQAVAESAVYPLRACNMSVAIDACIDYPKPHPLWDFSRWCQQYGTPIYAEGRPTKANPHWGENSYFALVGNYERGDSDGWGLPDSAVAGEKVLIEQGNNADSGTGSWTDNYSGWEAQKIKTLLNKYPNHTICSFFSRIFQCTNPLYNTWDALES